MRFRGAGADLTFANFERDNGLIIRQSFARYTLESGRLAYRFEKDGDYARLIILDEIIYHVCSGNHGFIAHRYQQAQPDMPRLRQGEDCARQRSALQYHANGTLY